MDMSVPCGALAAERQRERQLDANHAAYMAHEIDRRQYLDSAETELMKDELNLFLSCDDKAVNAFKRLCIASTDAQRLDAQAEINDMVRAMASTIARMEYQRMSAYP